MRIVLLALVSTSLVGCPKATEEKQPRKQAVAEEADEPVKQKPKEKDEDDAPAAKELQRRVFLDGKYAILAPAPIDLEKIERKGLTAYEQGFKLEGRVLRLKVSVREKVSPGLAKDPGFPVALLKAELAAFKGTEVDRVTRKLKKSGLTATIVEYTEPNAKESKYVAVFVTDDRTFVLVRATPAPKPIDKAWFDSIVDSFEVLGE